MMWEYTDKVLDHFKNPRNVGSIPNPSGVGQVGSLACGDALKLFITVDNAGVITDAKFQTFGCASAIASSSALTEMVKGMHINEAARITNKEIADFLGGLPDAKMHCSVMGREALEAAIENYHTGKTGKKVLEGKVICNCFGVTQEEIERVIRENALTTVEEVTNYCKAGGGCGSCIPDIEDILAQLNAAQKNPVAHNALAAQIPIGKRLKMIEETLDREVRPLLRKDGGDLDLVDLIGNRVIISFRGMCAQCHAAQFTMKDVVEAKLRDFVALDLVVEEVRP